MSSIPDRECPAPALPPLPLHVRGDRRREGWNLPPYAYVPGHGPHPIRDPGGHLRDAETAPAVPLDLLNWRSNEAYLLGFDLFHDGFFWEAHEAWEGVWRVTAEPGPRALLQALIQLAAAIVKMREGRWDGVPAFSARIRHKLSVLEAEDLNENVAGLSRRQVAEAVDVVEAAARFRSLERLARTLPPFAVA